MKPQVLPPYLDPPAPKPTGLQLDLVNKEITRETKGNRHAAFFPEAPSAPLELPCPRQQVDAPVHVDCFTHHWPLPCFSNSPSPGPLFYRAASSYMKCTHTACFQEKERREREKVKKFREGRKNSTALVEPE